MFGLNYNVINPVDFDNEIRLIAAYLGLGQKYAKIDHLTFEYQRLTPIEKETFLKSVESFKVLSEVPTVDPRLSPGDNTVRDLEYLFNRWKLKTSGDFFEKITDEDCVELYRGSQQMYSNKKFHQLCSYDILYVLLYGFDQLFERDLFTTHRIMARVQEVCLGPLQTQPWNVPNHVLKEKDNTASKGMSFYIEPGYIAPVESIENEMDAPLWLSTLRATPITT